MSINTLIVFLENHQILMYEVLFLGAYFETLIGTSFLIYGEFFFLAGAILAGLGKANLWLILIVLYGGGLLGDHSSYWIGRRWGDGIYVYLQNKVFFKRYFTETNYNRGTVFFNTYGGWSVFIGRFLGPVSWITPFLAGIFRMPYVRFSLFDFPAVIFGIGQFIVVGYIFGKNYQTILAIAQQYILIGLFVAVCLAFIVYYYRRLLKKLNLSIKHSTLHYFVQLRTRNHSVIKRSILTVLVGVCAIFMLYVATVLTIFFIENQRLNGIIEPDLQNSFNTPNEIIQSIDSTTYYKNGTPDIGPINVILITNQSLDSLLSESGWIKDKTFIRDTVSFLSYFEQVEDNVFPISDLYFKGVPQNFAYQYASSTLSTREHVRVWNYGSYSGTPVYALSVSKDYGFDFYRNLSFLIPFHATEPNIDASRDLFTISLLQNSTSTLDAAYPSPLGKVLKKHESDSLYYTDGLIKLIEM